jgi:hypothetical protein
LDRLGNEDKARLQQVSSGGQGAQAQTNLGSVVNSPGFQRLSAEEQARTLQTFLAAPPSSTQSTRHLTSLLGSGGFQALSTADKAKALDVFQNTSLAGRGHLVDLANRTVNGRTALLDQDKDGNSLLGNLHRIATGPLEPSLATEGISRADLLSSITQEAAHPGQINQHNRSTCTVTSMQYMLCQSNPAEYTRLMQGLLSPQGQVQLRNGDTLRRVPDSIPLDTATARSSSERIFQSAMMDYANGHHTYSNVDNQSTGKDKVLLVFDRDRAYGGLYADQEERAIQALFGRDYKQYDGTFGNFRSSEDDILNKLTERSGQRTLMDLKWGDGGHAVVFEKVENGRVYFRNPWGPSGDANGTTYTEPPRRMEDNTTGLESMSVEDFKRHVRRCYLPN